MIKQQKSIASILLAACLFFAFLGVAFQPGPLQAQGSPLPTATPLGTPPPPPPANVYQPPAGGTIILHVYDAPTNGWTVVQWQDANGGWHDVEGWRSQITDGYVGWWVDPANFSSGPFRWLLLDAAQGETVAVSDSFYLPGFVDEVILIEISGGISQ